MFLFRNASVGDKAQLQKRMSLVPNEIIDGLLSKFTEHSRNSTTYVTARLEVYFRINVTQCSNYKTSTNAALDAHVCAVSASG